MRSRSQDTRQLTIDERSDFADFLAGLDDDAWERTTTCTGWTVRDLLAHIAAWDDMLIHSTRAGYITGLARWARAMGTSRFNAEELNRRFAADATATPGPALLDRFNSQACGQPRWLFDRVAPGAQLAEYVIHHHDARTAVGVDRVTPLERIRAALDSVRHLPGVRVRPLLATNTWIATDLGWTAGRGPVIEGTGEQILLVLSGRATRPGVEALRSPTSSK